MWWILLVLIFTKNVYGLWDRDVACPQLCTCRIEHITELAINNYMQEDYKKGGPTLHESYILESNDVLYEEDINKVNENTFIKSAMCIIQTETETLNLINDLPKEIESISLILAMDSGNKTVKLSYFAQFSELQIIHLESPQTLKQSAQNYSYFLFEIDQPLIQLKYLNLERVLLRQTRTKVKTADENELTFEYVQKPEGGAHLLTFVQHGINDKIVPYKVFVENMKNQDFPKFNGFANLKLLRISDCELNNIYWEMFEGLNNLNYLFLEKNKLRFIPEFAFYGLPNLKTLSLAWNDLLNIEITDLAGLLELEYLDLSYNNFSQLSELSLPPFPKLKLANFANNPITVVFPNTFEVMNTTNSLILGGLEQPLSFLANSFVGLKSLESLIILHCNIEMLKREILIGMPNLHELTISGNIPEFEYDAFLEVIKLNILILNKCNISKLSVDSFIGLRDLQTLDLSHNELTSFPPGIFDDLINLKELYLNNNKFKELPIGIFVRIHPRLIRLNENPWHCSCDMSDWKPIIINRIKQKSLKSCDMQHDKGVGCTYDQQIYYKFIYDNRVAPKCSTPNKFKNWSVFHVMRKEYRCPQFRMNIKKRILKSMLTKNATTEAIPTMSTLTEAETTKSSTEYFAPEKINSAEFNLKQINKLQNLNRKYARKLKLKKKLERTLNQVSRNDMNVLPSLETNNNESNDLF